MESVPGTQTCHQIEVDVPGTHVVPILWPRTKNSGQLEGVGQQVVYCIENNIISYNEYKPSHYTYVCHYRNIKLIQLKQNKPYDYNT